MKVKTFHALTMQDALRAIKDELGPDAIILSSKEVREGGRILRVFNRPVLEVMAASEQEASESSQARRVQPSTVSVRTSRAKSSSRVPAETFQQTLNGLLGTNRDMAILGSEQQEASPKPSLAPMKKSRLRQWRTVYDELGRLLHDLSPAESPAIPDQSLPLLAQIRRSLLEQGMNPSTVQTLWRKAVRTVREGGLSDEESTRGALRQEIAQRLHTTGPLLHGDARPAVALLIGPSGGGKTSAVAKLAAYYRREQRKSVALITFDTYRETAVEQLRRYAKLVGVPFACALSARQVHEGLRRHAQVDLVLIDMPGIGSDDLALARDLRRLLKPDTITTHLVLPASTREHEACRILGRLGDLPKLCLLYTKLDETESLGTIFEVVHSTGVPLSYCSVGRRVPGDIEVAEPERLAARLLAGDDGGSRVRASHRIRQAGAMSALTGTATYHG